MNLRTVVHLVSILVTFLGFSMFVCVPVGILMNDSDRPVWLMALCGCITTLLGIGCAFFSRSMHGKRLRSGVREGFATVSFGWLAALVFGALPFIVISDFHVADAIFETASGFTTTGASVIDSKLLLRNGTTLPNGVESLPYCLLFWRSLIVWLGGMGIVVFALVILPFLGVGGTNQLYNAEVPGLKTNSDQLTPRIASSAKILWLVFVALTVMEMVLLYVGGMNLFDAVCHSFCTIATGGFSTKNASIAHYSSPFVQWVIVIFMFLSACNFALSIKAAITKRWLIFFQDEEFKFFLILVLAAVGLSTLLLWSEHHEIVSLTGASEPNTVTVALRYAAFQVVSIVTSTGFSTADYNLWPAGIGMILFFLMFIGGCAGSTAGGIKCVRALLLGKHAVSEVRRCIFPRSIPDIRLNGERLPQATINKTLAFVFLYMGIFFVVALILPFFCEMDFTTALSASIACISNIGPGMNQVGPAATFGWMSAPAKYLLSFAMVIGRLELYTLLVVLMPSFWRR